MSYLDFDGLVQYTRLMKGYIGDEVASAISELSGALRFKGLLTGTVNLNTGTYASSEIGDTYFVSNANVVITYTDNAGSTQTAKTGFEIGDAFICIQKGDTSNAPRWVILQTNWSITTPSTTPTLSGTDAISLATVGGKEIKVKLNATIPTKQASSSVTVSGVTVTGSNLYGDATTKIGLAITTGTIGGTSDSNVVNGSAVKSYVDTIADKDISASGNAAGVTVTLGGTVSNPTIGVGGGCGVIAEGNASYVYGCLVYDALNATITSSNTASGIKAELGGKVNAPTISLTVNPGTVALNNTGVVTGGAVYDYLSSTTNVISDTPINKNGLWISYTGLHATSNGKISCTFEPGSVASDNTSVVTGSNVYDYVHNNLNIPTSGTGNDTVTAAFNSGMV